MTDSNIKGLAELQQALSEFPAKLFNSTVRKALYAGAKVIAKEAKLLCPVAPPSQTAAVKYGAKKGSLKKSIRSGTDKSNGVFYGYVKAGASEKNPAPYYAHFVEYGTAAHIIKPRKGTKALWIGDGFAAQVAHPGAAPKPFMRPALDTKRDEVLEAVRVVIAQAVEKNLKGPA